jgi:hypothetical protein
MFKKENINELIKLAVSRGERIDDEFYEGSPSHKLPSKLICDREEMISDMAVLLNVAGIAIEIRSSYRPDLKGKIEKIFRSQKEIPNV